MKQFQDVMSHTVTTLPYPRKLHLQNSLTYDDDTDHGRSSAPEDSVMTRTAVINRDTNETKVQVVLPILNNP
jgi:hypothetical protein